MCKAKMSVIQYTIDLQRYELKNMIKLDCLVRER